MLSATIPMLAEPSWEIAVYPQWASVARDLLMDRHPAAPMQCCGVTNRSATTVSGELRGSCGFCNKACSSSYLDSWVSLSLYQHFSAPTPHTPPPLVSTSVCQSVGVHSETDAGLSRIPQLKGPSTVAQSQSHPAYGVGGVER